MPGRNEIEADLVAFLQTRSRHGAEVTRHTDLLDSGVLDSLLLVDLIFQIEDRYGVRFESEHVSPANFRTVSAIVALVTDRLQYGGGRPQRVAAGAARQA
jgi:acyl carrier protein